MNINKESYASLTPSIDITRSRFEMNHGLFSSANLGMLVPIEVTEVLPGDSFEYKTSAVLRMQPLVAPLMDDIRADIFWFFCPDRIVWNHTKEFFGENTQGPWYPTVEYNIPQTKIPARSKFISVHTDASTSQNFNYYEVGAIPGTILDYMGIPNQKVVPGDPDELASRFAYGIANGELDLKDYFFIDPDYFAEGAHVLTDLDVSVSSLPIRMYCAIVNEFFRSEALQNPVNYSLGDSTTTAVTNPSTDLDDYVTELEKGGYPFVACKLFDIFTGCLPTAQRAAEPVMALPDSYVYFGDRGTRSSSDIVNYAKDNGVSNPLSANNYIMTAGPQSESNLQLAKMYTTSNVSIAQPVNWMVPGVSVEQIRVAFQVQKFYEATARSGGRYRSILESLFHVHASDQSMQVPQFLGSQSFYLNINQVLQTSESNETPQGNPAGYSVTNHTGYDFMQSFTEHGYIIGLMTTRYHHTYQQAVDETWFMKDKFDIYWPQFANVGEQPTLGRNICLSGVKEYDEQVFGYQEAWARYRYKFNMVTGEMRSNVKNSMDMYHLADDYRVHPYLGSAWIHEDKSTLDRCLAVTSDVANQFWFNLYFDITATRPMPVHSIPGLIDHH